MPNPTIYLGYPYKIPDNIAPYTSGEELGNEIYSRLRRMGMDVFYDKNVLAGQNWAVIARQKLNASDCLVVVLASDTLINSTGVLAELRSAIGLQKRIIPLLIKGFSLANDIPNEFAVLRDVKCVFLDTQNIDPALQQVVKSVDSDGNSKHPWFTRWVRRIAIGTVLGVLFAFLALFPEKTRTDWFCRLRLISDDQCQLTPSPTTQAAVIASNTPSSTDAPTVAPTATDAPTITTIPPTPTPLPTATPVPPSATTAPTDTPIPPTNTNTPAPSQVQIAQQFDAPGGLPNGIACSANGLLLADNSTAMFEINTSGKLLAVYQSPDPTPVGLGSDGTHFWVQTTNRNLIHEFQISGSQLSAGRSFESPVTVVGGTNDMAWDGSAWWIADQFNLHHIDSAGNRLNPLPFPKTIAGVDWDGTYLWLAFTASPTLSVYDQQGNIIQTFASPIPEIQGLAWCGTELWAIGRDQIGSEYQVYQLAIAGWSVSPLPTNTAVPPTATIVQPTVSVSLTQTDVKKSFPCNGTIRSAGGNVTILNVVRDVPDLSGRLRFTVQVGQIISVLTVKYDNFQARWYQIEDQQGLRLGWILEQYLSLSSSCPVE